MQKSRTFITALFSPTVVGIMLAAAAVIAAVIFGSTNPALGPKAKFLCYVIAAIALLSVALYVWNEFQKAQDRERLSEYLSQAASMLDECVARYRNAKGPPTTEVDEWIRNASGYIECRLGKEGLLRFRDAPPSSTTPFVGFGMHEQYWEEYRRIYARIEVLKKLIDEQAAR
jgi:hypothetical protein